MGLVVWVMMGIAVWHFTVFLPDRFWGGIVGAFLAAIAGAALFGFIVNGGDVPGRHDTHLIQALIAIPGSMIGLGLSYLWGSRVDRAAGVDHGFTRAGSHLVRLPAARAPAPAPVPSGGGPRMARMDTCTSRWSSAPYEVAGALRLERALGLSPTVAAVLARRGPRRSGGGAALPGRRGASRPARPSRPAGGLRADPQPPRARVAHRRARRLRRGRGVLHRDPGRRAAGAGREPDVGDPQPLRRRLRPLPGPRSSGWPPPGWTCWSPWTAGSPPWPRWRRRGRRASTWWSPITTGPGPSFPIAPSCIPPWADTGAPSCAPPGWR